jgi:hypothetical protein
MAREHRRDLPLDRLEFVIGRRAREIEEDFRNAIEAAPAAFQRVNRIGEGRRLWICRDGVDLGAMVIQRDVESGPKMRRVDAVEGRRLERSGPGLQERVLVNVGLGHHVSDWRSQILPQGSRLGRSGPIVAGVRIAIFDQRVRRLHARASNRPGAS